MECDLPVTDRAKSEAKHGFMFMSVLVSMRGLYGTRKHQRPRRD